MTGTLRASDRLGLFDTPPDRRQIRFGTIIVALLFGALLAIMPIRQLQLGALNAFVPAVNSIMLASELIIATLLYAQAAVFRSRALAILASGYLFASLLLIPHTLTFPGAFTPTGLLSAGINTTAWLGSFRQLAFPIAIVLYVAVKSIDAADTFEAERSTPRVGRWIAGTIALVALVTLVATSGHDFLPPFFVNHRDGIIANLIILNSVTIVLALVAMAMVVRQKMSLLDMWLLVALCGWLTQSLLNLTLHGRFTLGWYCLFSLMLASSLIVVMALVAESNRLYGQLAILASARNRERNTRLMSIDGVAAAIAHEVGQPLAAVKLSASASLAWLEREKPDFEKAIGTLRDTIDASQRTFDVIRSVRAISTHRSGAISEFNPNDLVRETASLLNRDLVAQKVTLELALDQSMPQVLANRVQIQRVLVNLITNAIESLATTLRPTRRIVIRTSQFEGESLLIDVCDSGSGVSQEKLATIFEPFETTKSAGRGLGLSLSRAIVEEHGGRLWASNGEQCGTTFHIQLRLA